VVVALDAASGHIRWQNTTCGMLDPSRFGLETVGAMTIAQGRLWVRGNAFSLADGTVTVDRRYPYIFPNPVNQLLARVTGVIGDHLIWGGRRFWSEQHSTDWSDVKQNAYIAGLDGKGAILPEPGKNGPGTRAWNEAKDTGVWGMPLMPSWDHELVLITGRFPSFKKTWDPRTYRTLIVLDRASFLAACDDRAKPVLASEKGAKDTPIGTCMASRTPAERWRIDGPSGSRWLAMLLTADAVLAVNDPINDEQRLAKRMEGYGYSPRAHALPLDPLPNDKPCQLIAFNRADGSERWRVSLPSEPVMDGLAVARDGSLVVQLLDGGIACVGEGTR
jgi:hypothetical protein